MNYMIFNQILASDIPLPELPEISSGQATLSFTLSVGRFSSTKAINWVHDWLLSNGNISFSVGIDDNGVYWLRFPQTVDFRVDPFDNHITGYCYSNIPYEIIRHLLLDQVIPRLLQHQGKHILHASCVRYDSNTALAFAGESGRGKSTLGVYWYNQGYSLLTDDCLMMQKKKDSIASIPNYQGVRLLKESTSLLLAEKDTIREVCCGAKKRVIMDNGKKGDFVPLRAIIVLEDPSLVQAYKGVSIRGLVGAEAAIALVENSFPLDVTDKIRMGKQLCSLAEIAGSAEISIYKLYFPRRIEYLPEVFDLIRDTCLMVNE